MFRGFPACPCQVIWLPVYEDELQRRGILTGTLPIAQLIGGAAASGNTHINGGAADFWFRGRQAEQAMAVARELGADATFHRLPNWDGKGGDEHNHSVLTDCPHNGPARYQIDAVRDGFNGLGTGGRGARDTGPRPLSGRTWREGVAWAKQLQEDDMADSASQQKLDAILNGVNALREAEARRAKELRARTRAILEALEGLDEKVANKAGREQVKRVRELIVEALQEPTDTQEV